MLVMVSLYLSARHKRWINLTDGMIGWADLLLLACLALYLPLLNYMLFFIGSSVVILVGWLGYQAFARAKSPFIPFAGCQALLFGGLLVFSWASATDLFNDYWFFQLVSR
ncbi:hypothetical protein A0256_20845 [Mucilaginibacter sp. PAMC 26640]|nr:hypothetical protein A0256_20845 [Mucilaginibacter sp. PAMC 26640]